jgi:glycosyltransferase involved in cell wall biosynthesis
LSKKFSIIIPAYLEEKRIKKILSEFSKYSEEYDYEIILSDGGSMDKTVEIAKEFTSKIYIHTENRRQTIAEGRNMGTGLAKSDFYVFINADALPKNMREFLGQVSNWASGIGKYNGKDAIACSVLPFPDEEKSGDKYFYGFFNWYFALLNKIGVGMGRGECQLIAREIFEAENGYNPKFVAGEDFDLFRRIAKRGFVAFASDIVIYESPRRFHKQGYFRTIFRWSLNAISVMFSSRSASKEWESVR